MAIGVGEIDTPPAVVVVDLARTVAPWDVRCKEHWLGGRATDLGRKLPNSNRERDVGSCPKADITRGGGMSAFRGKPDMMRCANNVAF